jgi:hypothetical protein
VNYFPKDTDLCTTYGSRDNEEGNFVESEIGKKKYHRRTGIQPLTFVMITRLLTHIFVVAAMTQLEDYQGSSTRIHMAKLQQAGQPKQEQQKVCQ